MARTKASEAKLIDMARQWYSGTLGNDRVANWRERASTALGFYDGTGQWEPAVARLLESQGRPALTINRILPVVNVIWGTQLKNRREIHLYPRKRATKAVAELGSALIKHTMDCCNGYDAVSDCYRDGIITGKGWVTLDRVFDQDPIQGDVQISAPNPLLIFEDPRNKHYDADRCEFIFRERFVTKTELKAHYPRKAKDALDAMTNDWSQRWVRSAGGEEVGYMAQIANWLDKNAGGDGWQGSGEKLPGVCVRECWYRTFEAVSIASVLAGQEFVTTRLETNEDYEKLASFQKAHPEHDIQTKTTVIPILHLQVMVGDLLLKHEDDPLNGMTSFPYVRFSPYWLHGHAFGVVDNLEGPQEEHNKMRSQVLHMLNTASNPAWKANKANPHGRTMIEQFGSTPGVLLDLNDFGGLLERIDPSPLSVGHFTLGERSQNDIREISGANPDITGTQTEQSESGRARLIRQEAGLTTLAPLVANMQRTEATFGTALWEFIRHNDVYSPEEIEAVIDEDILEKVGGMEGAIEAMNRWDTGSYGVKTAAAPITATYRDAQLEQVREVTALVASLGLQLPPEVAAELVREVLDLATFPGSDKIAEMIKAAGPALQMIPPAGAPRPRPAPAMAGAV